MKMIYKYTLAAHNCEVSLHMRKGAKILSVQMQGDSICMWAEVDSLGDDEVRDFFVVGTGLTLPGPGKFLGTVQRGPFVFHVYEEE